MKSVHIIKASGEQVIFDIHKLQKSLRKSGATKAQIDKISHKIQRVLRDGMTTTEIYNRAFNMLSDFSRASAARYKLKKAIMELGPTGYPFERFIGAILEHQGYHVEVGKFVKGHCVTHEVDVIADMDDRRYMVECKFHNRKAHNSDVKVPLYIHSRFTDIRKKWLERDGLNDKFHQGWIVTNTRFTEDAMKFGKCAGLKLISWDYPQGGSLKQMIDSAGLHPVTCLTTLTHKDKERVLNQNIVLCRELIEHEDMLSGAGIPRGRIDGIMEEVTELCNLKKSV